MEPDSVRMALDSLGSRRPKQPLEPVSNCPGCGSTFPSGCGVMAMWQHMTFWEGAHARVRQNIMDILGEGDAMDMSTEAAILKALGFRFSATTPSRDQQDATSSSASAESKPKSNAESSARSTESEQQKGRRRKGKSRGRRLSQRSRHRSRSSPRAARRRQGRRRQGRRDRSRSRMSESRRRYRKERRRG
mmetsp:Transcript_4164/g.7470  ORF Transcript_4164/g.7470 Transcript_4164/m.7470 type:complete len:190 (+) Transcript_4164:56-625(+)